MPASWVSNEQALASLCAAAQREESGREDAVAGPDREMLADLLLEWKRPTDALAQYRAIRKDDPNRFDALCGAARSAEAASDHTQAQEFCARRIHISLPGADRPELQTAQTIADRHSSRIVP